MTRTDEQRKYERDRYHRNPKRRASVITAARWSRMLRQFGLTRAQWGALFEQQGRSCACCRKDLGDGFRAAVDHDHVTGLVRGILCFDCNTSIGKLGDNAAGLARALAYLEPPAETIDEHW